jgi:hypothetical protein
MVVRLPSREFLVEVRYLMQTTHRVRARCVDEALRLAPDAEIDADMQVIDIVSAHIVREERQVGEPT